MKFRFCTLAIAISIVVPTMHSPMAIASLEEDNARLLYYGMGTGVALTLCDLMDSGVLSKSLGHMFVSNFKRSLLEESIGYTAEQAIKDGFNGGAEEFSECSLQW